MIPHHSTPMIPFHTPYNCAVFPLVATVRGVEMLSPVCLLLPSPGILVLSAREGGPAWKSGIRGTSRDEYGRLVLGDIITAVNGKNVRNSSDLYRMLDKARVSVTPDIGPGGGGGCGTVCAQPEILWGGEGCAQQQRPLQNAG
jgi:hypothetical protein